MKKKVVVLVDWFSPGFKGGGLIKCVEQFALGLYNELDISIITTNVDLTETVPYPTITPNTWVTWKHNIKVFYANDEALGFSAMRKNIDAINPDYVYLHNVYSYHFGLIPLLLTRFGYLKYKLVLAPNGMFQQGALQFKKFKKSVYLTLLNMLNIQKGISFHATDDQEVKDIKSVFGQDVPVYNIACFTDIQQPAFTPIEKKTNDLKLVFLSRISPKKNLLGALEMLKGVKSNVSYDIIGPLEDKEYWQKCQKAIAELPSNVKVTYIGEVEEAVLKKMLSEHHLFYFPTHGENYGYVMFEALQCSLPIIISQYTLWKNLAAQKAGYDLTLEEPQLFVDVLEKFAAMPQQEFDEWRKGAWQYAHNYIESNVRVLRADYSQMFS